LFFSFFDRCQFFFFLRFCAECYLPTGPARPSRPRVAHLTWGYDVLDAMLKKNVLLEGH